MSQPPLGRQIQQLESELGAQLFKRGRKGVSLTAAGQEFYFHAQQILGSARAATEQVALVESGMLGTLRLEFSDDFLYGPLAELVSHFKADNPKATLSVKMAYGVEIVDRVMNGQTDIGVVETPLPATARGLHAELLDPVPIQVALPKRHPLAARAAIHLHELANEVFLCGPIDPETALYVHAINLFGKARISPVLMTDLWPTEFMIEMTAAGAGATLLPFQSRPKRDGVAFLGLLDADASIQGCMIWRPETEHRGSVRRFLERVRRTRDEDQKRS